MRSKYYSKNYMGKIPSEKELKRIKLWGEIITLTYRIAELKEELERLEKENE